jgi:hypothetical protein
VAHAMLWCFEHAAAAHALRHIGKCMTQSANLVSIRYAFYYYANGTNSIAAATVALQSRCRLL